MVVLHPVAAGPGALRGPQRAVRQHLRAVTRTLGLRLVLAPCRGRYGYRDQLAAVWPGPHRLLIVEQDVVPTLGQLRRLAACPQPCCAHTYLLPARTVGARRVWGHRHLTRWNPAARWANDTALVTLAAAGATAAERATGQAGDWREGDPADRWVSGCWVLGAAAYGPAVRALVPPAFWAIPHAWEALDTRLSWLLSRTLDPGCAGREVCHLHGPVEHRGDR